MATTTETTTQQMNPFVQDVYARNYNFAQNVANQPYQAYTGPRVANFRPEEQQAFDIARNAVTNRVGSDQLNAATAAAQGLTTYGADQFQKDISGYMSPFQTNVIDATMARMAQARAERDAATKAQMAASRGFGNERRGVYEAQLAGEQELNNADILSKLYQQGFTQAADIANTVANRRLNAARDLAEYGKNALSNEQTYANMLNTVGSTQRDMAQRNLDIARQDWETQRNYPKEQLQTLLAATQGMPSPFSTTATTTTPGAGATGTISDILAIAGGIDKIFGSGTVKNIFGGR